jgi:hypothetical protein
VNTETLLKLAREREDKVQGALTEMLLEPPDQLLRELRYYLVRQVDHDRAKHTNEKIIQLALCQEGLNELACLEAKFSSGALLKFRIQLEKTQCGWLVKRFQFHIRFKRTCRIDKIQIHLNQEASRDPLEIPRCHVHIGDSRAHIPFPIMDPRLILHLICECIEPDFGI